MKGASVKFDRDQFVRDVKGGDDESRLMKKYDMSARLLGAVLLDLFEKGVLAWSDLEGKKVAPEARESSSSRCPSCNSWLARGVLVCTGCGATIEKAQRSSQPISDSHEAVEELPKKSPHGSVTAPTRIIGGVKALSFRGDIFPINRASIKLLEKDFLFWAVSALGVVPLLIATLASPTAQIMAFAAFFAAIWGVIFKRIIVPEGGSWKEPIFSMVFTGTIGLSGLLLVNSVVPSWFVGLAGSQNRLISLLGCVFQVGMFEELCKILPVLLYLRWQRKQEAQVHSQTLILLGVFSGLGFAPVENVGYANQSVLLSTALGVFYGVPGLAEGVAGALANVMLRSLSLVFCHAVWSGIFAYFVSMSIGKTQSTKYLFLVGLAAAAFLHGMYDWFCQLDMTLAALTAGLSFMLFYAYVAKSRLKSCTST